STFGYENFQHRLFSSSKKGYQFNTERLGVLTKVLFAFFANDCGIVLWRIIRQCEINCPDLFCLQVYSPLIIHKEGSEEWSKLIKSGKVWENYFCPFEWRAQDYGMNHNVLVTFPF